MTVKVNNGKIIIDLAGSSKQMTGPVNCGFAQTVSACRVAFKNLINPKRPVDGGTFKTLEVKAPEGSIFWAKEPAACQWYFSILGLLIDAFIKALSPVLKEQSAAGHYGDSMVFILHGVDHRKDSPFIAVEPTPGGWGAWNKGDGADALINNVNGAFKDIPIEIYENKYPVTIRNYGIRKDTGGPGKMRGGNGLYKEYTVNTNLNLSLWFERSKTTGWGLFGGKDAIGPNVNLQYPNGKSENRLKSNSYPVLKGTKITTYTGGGGGFGNAYNRDPKNVLDDVKNGYVSINMAKKQYGVIISNNLKINYPLTLKLRKKK